MVNDVKHLGRKYSIITPYTSMLVTEPGTLVEDKTSGLPEQVRLLQNSPNPFNPSTTIRFAIPRLDRPRNVSLRIYDATGRLVKTLVNELTLGGNFTLLWDGRDSRGAALGSGLYLAVLETGNKRLMVRMQLVK